MLPTIRLEWCIRGLTGAGLAIGVLTGVSPREVLTLHADLVLESIADLETALDLVR